MNTNEWYEYTIHFPHGAPIPKVTIVIKDDKIFKITEKYSGKYDELIDASNGTGAGKFNASVLSVDKDVKVFLNKANKVVAYKEIKGNGTWAVVSSLEFVQNKKAEIEAEIKQIENTLSNCEIIDATKTSNKKVALGSSVTIRNIDFGTESTFTIVGSVESDPVNGKISNACPLGEAIIGKSVGDIVDIKAVKQYKVEILKIEIK